MGAAGLAVRARRVCRRTADDRPARDPVSPLPEAATGRGGACRGRQGAARLDGGPRRDGHVRQRRRELVAAPPHAGRLHGDGRLLRDGLGRGLSRRLRRPADRRRARRLGTRLVLAEPLLRASSHAGEVLGAADRPGGRRSSASSARSATSRSRPCSGTAASASAACSPSSSPT